MGAKATANPDQLYQVMTGLTNIEGACKSLTGSFIQANCQNLSNILKVPVSIKAYAGLAYSKCDKLNKLNPKYFELSIRSSLDSF